MDESQPDVVRASLEHALRSGYDLADALDHAHRQGVVHRDVKPDNVLIDDSGRALLAKVGERLEESRARRAHRAEALRELWRAARPAPGATVTRGH